jgi:hypothetical protein
MTAVHFGAYGKFCLVFGSDTLHLVPPGALAVNIGADF